MVDKSFLSLIDPNATALFREEVRVNLEAGIPTSGFNQRYNPLLSLFNALDGQAYFEGIDVRSKAARLYAWAIPSFDALQMCADYSPLVEMGAGSGYWAALLQTMGVEIDPYDGFTKQFEYKKQNTWTEVQRGSAEVLNNYPPEWSLLLIWPPYDDPFGTNCLLNFTGDTLVYIGEGAGGCNGDDMFHFILNNAWRRIDSGNMPSWQHINDGISVHRRTVPRHQVVDYINAELDSIPEDEKFWGYPTERL